MKQKAPQNNFFADSQGFIRSMIAEADFKLRAYGDMPYVINLYFGRRMMTVPIEWENDDHKHATLDTLRLFIQALEPEAYVVIAETWWAPFPREGEPFVCASQHPEREEGILCLLVPAQGESLAGFARIQRNPDGSYGGYGEVEFTDEFGLGLLSALFPDPSEPRMPREMRRALRRDILGERERDTNMI